ncbi:putative transporter svop-1 isoform X2 [Phlebotomus papatasi]|uniref:putative transporter svop-1 isoform X2 n=1 Tax=Phlebotomus papatasi TaxID=29031 RepID=UPI002483E5B5|nr:putative transporter svop-1 isoform X2 [Phlebotomus papatasi]
MNNSPQMVTLLCDLGNESKNFEEAILATKFGLFNIILLASCMIWFTASLIETTTSGVILPIAQCDLDLDPNRKGWLTSITFFGMIFGATIWGIIGDIYGRKIIISGGVFLLGIFNIVYGFSTSYYMLVTLKFFGGVIASGPVAAYMVYVCEFHGVKYRVRVLMLMSAFISIGAVNVMVIALLILTRPINFTIGSTEYHSWQVFFWACSIIGLSGGFISLFLPESPKFLMSLGRNEEALRVFQRIYRINTRKSSDSYPIKSLKDESKNASENQQNVVYIAEHHGKAEKSPTSVIWKAFSQFLPLFRPPYLGKCLLAGGIEFFLLLGANTMRLWMPQVFALLSDSDSNDGICEHIVQPEISKFDFTNHTDDNVCQVLNDKSIYVNSIVVQAVGVLGVFLAVSLVTTVGNKTILIVTSMVASVATVAIYFAKNSVTIVILYSLSVGIAFSGQASFNSIVPNLVPTAFRFTVISVSVTLGRLGSMLGNLIFPNLMQLGCWQPFITIGLAFFIPAVLCLFLPRTTKQPLS